MAKGLERLGGVKAVEKVTRDFERAGGKEKLYGDGGGLYLRLRAKAQPAWQFISTKGGGRVVISLGGMSLADARRIAREMREAVAAGRDPREALPRVEKEGDTSKATAVPTFGEFAEDYIASVEKGWRNPVHRQQWRNSLRDHAAPLKTKPVDEIGTDDVLAVLRPIWLTKSETASRVRGRIEKILDAAKARGLRSRDALNPAQWRGHLALLLPKQSKLTRGHHAALPYEDAPAFWSALNERPALAARCLEFTILTAARSGEALGATWGEIDMGKAIWTVPANRMKAATEHVVPLSGAALDVLKKVWPDEPKPTDLVFAVGGAARSNMAMTMLLRRMGRGDITVHGFRSTFRDWAGDATAHPREVIESALAHTIENKAERAYRRSSAIERRRMLMEDWATYLVG